MRMMPESRLRGLEANVRHGFRASLVREIGRNGMQVARQWPAVLGALALGQPEDTTRKRSRPKTTTITTLRVNTHNRTYRGALRPLMINYVSAHKPGTLTPWQSAS